MELIYTDGSKFNDVGILNVKSGDFAWGTDENDFELTLAGAQEVPDFRSFIYVEGTDVFGVVRGVDHNVDGSVRVRGVTWTGLLENRVLKPPSGSAYFTVSGDMRDCASSLIKQLGATDVFAVTGGKSGVSASHTFKGRNNDEAQTDTGRYKGGWSALWQLLVDHKCKAVARYDDVAHKVMLSITKAEDLTDTEDMEQVGTAVAIGVKKPVNHLVCLGQGELAERTVLDLYMDSKGNVSTTQSLKGLDEIADVYDDSGAEDAKKLKSDGTDKLKEYWSDSQNVDISLSSDRYDLGDLVGGTDPVTGIRATATVTKKGLSFSGTVPTVSYETTLR